MYCTECGSRASGKFCSACGARLAGPGPEPPGAPDWTEEVRYHVLVHLPEVRDLIARHAEQAPKGLTGENVVKFCDKALAPLMAISWGTASGIAEACYRMGFRAEKTRTADLAQPAGTTLVAALCSFARRGRPLKQVHQEADGCILEATLPADLRTFAGEVVVAVRRQGPGTRVELAARIPTQLVDWGKRETCLNQLLDDLTTLPRESFDLSRV